MNSKNKEMKQLDVTVCCRAWYTSHIMVPADMNFDEAIQYAKDHLPDIPIESELEYADGSDVIDPENCCFDEDE